MSTIKNVEDLKTWQEARVLSKSIHVLTRERSFLDDPDLKRQMKRSSGSIMDNIAEGFERGGNKELIQFLYIAKGSCGELRSQLFRSCDNELIPNDKAEPYIRAAKQLSFKIQAFIKYLRGSQFKGDKFIVQEPASIYTRA